MNKTISILIMSLCCVMATENTFASPAQKKSVKELIKLSDLENLLHSSLDEMQPALDSKAESMLLKILGKERLTTNQEHLALVELSQLLKDTSSKMFMRPETLQTIEQIYTETLSEEEVQAYLNFLRTPEGKSINQKNLTISSNVFQYMNNLNQKTLNDPEQNLKLKEQLLSIIKPLIQDE